jgi:hypothetical protein
MIACKTCQKPMQSGVVHCDDCVSVLRLKIIELEARLEVRKALLDNAVRTREVSSAKMMAARVEARKLRQRVRELEAS